MLAWEWAKYRDETVNQRKRPMRKSLATLFAIRGPDGKPMLDTRRYHLTHLEGAALKRFSVHRRASNVSWKRRRARIMV